MSVNRGVDKEDVIHIYNGILLSHKKEQNNVICSDMDGPRDCHNSFLKIALLEDYNYHTTKFTSLKCTIQCILVYSQSCTTINTV